MVSMLCLTGLHEDLTPRDSRNHIAPAYASFADEAHLQMALDVLDNNFFLTCKVFVGRKTVFRHPRDFRTVHVRTHTNDVTIVEAIYLAREALRLTGGPQPPFVPPWLMPLAVCGNADQLQRLIDGNDEADGSDSSRDCVSSSGVLQEVDVSAASLTLEWIQYSAFGAVDQAQPLKSFEESNNESHNPAATAEDTFADVEAMDVPSVDEPKWAEGFNCPSHAVPCHLGCWNGFVWTLSANSNDSKVADLY
ncbi:hypothetical protein DAPPUDRAFT_117233 [Daphnia pulex]|uniref:Uncharacterized protein n=1 Tax=Daphnia pulex TaxID=6669 RepID=E9HRZ3_DAPPU|nr:hypothetical protein DAPPUDRAFT_117233 [Daphnia pulex]|eukprot:EFX65466.1 hypothetical protein DAPPUDRAFT_117233 [Daphnia pulex]